MTSPIGASSQTPQIQPTTNVQSKPPVVATPAPVQQEQPPQQQDVAITGTYKADGMEATFSAPTPTPLSPEIKQLILDIAASIKPPIPNVGASTLVNIVRKLIADGIKSEDDIQISLQGMMNNAGSNRALAVNDIKGLARDADYPFHNSLQSESRYDPTLTPKQVEKMNKDENRLVPLADVWKKSLGVDAGVNVGGSGKGEKQKGGTTESGGATPPAKDNKISLGDIFNQKMLGLGIHFNFENVKNTGGINIPSWLSEKLQNVTTQGQAEKLMDMLIGYLTRVGVLPPSTKPTTGGNGSGGNGNGG